MLPTQFGTFGAIAVLEGDISGGAMVGRAYVSRIDVGLTSSTPTSIKVKKDDFSAISKKNE